MPRRRQWVLGYADLVAFRGMDSADATGADSTCGFRRGIGDRSSRRRSDSGLAEVLDADGFVRLLSGYLPTLNWPPVRLLRLGLDLAQRLQSAKPRRKRARSTSRGRRKIVHACGWRSCESHISRGDRIRTEASALAGASWRCGCRKTGMFHVKHRAESPPSIPGEPWAGSPHRARGFRMTGLPAALGESLRWRRSSGFAFTIPVG